MKDHVEFAIVSLIMGVGVGLLAYAGRDFYVRALNAVEKDFTDKLRRLRVGTRHLRKLLVTWTVVIGAILLIVSFPPLDSPIFALTFAGLVGAVPWYVVRRMAQIRRQRIEDQLADSMVSLSGAIRAGLSLGQSLEILANQSPHPIGQEFRQIVGEFQMGKPLERCLVETRERLRSENFALFAAALLASRESGGRLNETVERIANSVLELQRLERKVLSETAQARTSAIYMAMVPPVVLALYWYVVDQQATERLFTDFWGQIMLCTALILNVIAYLWARAILNPDI